MSVEAAQEIPWSQVSRLIADTTGLHFPEERRGDLLRGLSGAAKERGLADAAACAEWLLSSPPSRMQLDVLARHLTVGETYFFRERRTFEVLADEILPALIRERRTRGRSLRVWSAACCTGEEAYSLAIMLHQLLPDLEDWRVSILATDINGPSLQKAEAGSYGEWSFRDAPGLYQERYFHRCGNGRRVVRPEIRRMVTFARLNLVDDVYPSPVTDTQAMDLIFCRNVLMYFSPAQAGRVIGRLHRSLAEGGVLAVSPSEASQALFPQFATLNFPGTILFRKDGAKAGATLPPGSPARCEATASFADESGDATSSGPLAVPPAEKEPAATAPNGPEAVTVPEKSGLTSEMRARSFANRGMLAEALVWCDRWIAEDKLDHAGHHFRAVILLEQGRPAEARDSLLRAVYLRPDCVLAHFALGKLERGRGRLSKADRHMGNALRLLARHRPDDIVPESDNLTTGRLAETIAAFSRLNATR